MEVYRNIASIHIDRIETADGVGVTLPSVGGELTTKEYVDATASDSVLTAKEYTDAGIAGIIPDIEIGTVTTAGAGGSASATMDTDGSGNKTLNLTIPAGPYVLGYATKAAMDADLAHVATTLAHVTNDTTPGLNGEYVKLGASGAGSWQKTLLDANLTNPRLLQLLIARNAIFSGNLHNYIADMVSFVDGTPYFVLTDAAKNADGTYTIQPGGKITAYLKQNGFTKTSTLTGYMAVYQTDPTQRGLVGELIQEDPAPHPVLATLIETYPGLWEGSVYQPGGVYTVIKCRMEVSNGGASPITILLPYAGTTPYVLSYPAVPVAAAGRPGKLVKFGFTRGAAGRRDLEEKSATVYVDIVNGLDANGGTLRLPKQTLAAVPTLVADNQVGFWRGSRWAEQMKTGNSTDPGGGGNVAGIILRDVQQQRSYLALPVITALDDVVNGDWVDNGNGTYSYTFAGVDALVNNGYDEVYCVEIDTTTETATPIAAQYRPTRVANLGLVAATVGSDFAEALGGNSWKITIHPTDGAAPGTKYRYAVTRRYTCARWDAREGHMEGFMLIGGNWGYGSVGSTGQMNLDRMVILHGSTHHAVLGGGTLSRSIFSGRGFGSGNIAVAFYAPSPGLAWEARECLFYRTMPDAIICHTSGGHRWALGKVIDCAFMGSATPDGAGGILVGKAITFNDITKAVVDGAFVDTHRVGIEPVVTTSFEVKNSVLKDVGIGINAANDNSMSANIHDNIIRTRSQSDPANINNRGAYGIVNPGANWTVQNNLFHIRSTAQVLGSDGGTNFIMGVPVPVQGNIVRNIVLFDSIKLDSAAYFRIPATAPWGFVADYNLIISNVARNMVMTAKVGGGGPAPDWDAYIALTGQDANSLFVDISADPRGLKAVFVDPDSGDYRFAQTDLGKICADYCVTNNVGPAKVISAWPEVPTVDDAYEQLKSL